MRLIATVLPVLKNSCLRREVISVRPQNKRVDLQFNDERAVQLFTILQELWEAKASIFREVTLPQDKQPVSLIDHVEAANYFSYAAIPQRGGVVSEDTFTWINHVRKVHPDLFNPHLVVRNWSIPTIMAVIERIVTDRKSWKHTAKQEQLFNLSTGKPRRRRNKRNKKKGRENKGVYKLDEFSTSWFNNSVALVDRWEGNLLNVFEGVAEFEAAFARIDEKNKNNKDKAVFKGIRRKIFSLLTIWLQEKELIPIFPTPVPVDFHALRLLFATGVIEPVDLPPFIGKPEKSHPAEFNGRPMLRITERLTDKVALWSQPFMMKHGFSHMAINPALWVLSRKLCRLEFQNKTQGPGRDREGEIKLIYPEQLEADPSLWPIPYSSPELACPLSRLCELRIPAGPYYKFGILALLRRVAYPHQRLPGMNGSSFENYIRK